VLGFASVSMFLFNLSISHCCILFALEASGMLHLFKCQTKANQRHLPAVTSPGPDLCSLITISDHLVLILSEERTKTFETIYIAAIAAANSSDLDAIFIY
jgi:hypothetical protein